MNETIRIRMLCTVRPELPFLATPGTILWQGTEYHAATKQHGAISGLCANGEYLGVRPGEFEFIEAPEWVLAIHMGAKKWKITRKLNAAGMRFRA